MLKYKLLLITLILLLPIVLLAPRIYAADIFKDACTTAPSSPACQQVRKDTAEKSNPIAGSKGIIQDVANVFALVAGAGGMILIVYSGFVYATAGSSIGGQRAGDDPTRARKARSTIVSVLTGMVIVAFAWLIVTFVNTRIIK